MASEQQNFVDAYLEADTYIIAVAMRFRDSPNRVVKRVARTFEQLETINASTSSERLEKVFQRAEQVFHDIGHTDLAIMFLAVWARVTGFVSPQDVHRLLKIGESIVNETTPFEIRTLLSMSTIAKIPQHKAVELIKSIVHSCPSDSPHRFTYDLNYLSFIANQGMLQPQLNRLEECRSIVASTGCRPGYMIPLIEMSNAIAIGDTKSVDRINNTVDQNSIVFHLHRQQYNYVIATTELFRMTAADQPVGHSITNKLRANLVSHLLNQRLERAYGQARDILATDNMVDRFELALRVELARGHTETARHLLDKNIQVRGKHFFDDFFHFRMARLSGNSSVAESHFDQLLKSIDRFGAAGRFDREVELSPELTPSTLLQVQRTKSSAKPSSSPVKKPIKLDLSDRFIGSSEIAKSIRGMIDKYGTIDSHLMLTGPTGSGKDLAARLVHQVTTSGSFVAVNCGSVADSLLESELFGHEKGAFTGAVTARKSVFEEAGKGTLFLDDVSSMPPRLQTALLRCLENLEFRRVGSNQPRPIHCRIIAATSQPLAELVDEGKFREDLMYRLQVLTLDLPPLAERREDIAELTSHFISRKGHLGTFTLDSSFVDRLKKHNWPGNVRELASLVERLCLFDAETSIYTANHLEGLLSAPSTSALKSIVNDRTGHTGPAARIRRSRNPVQRRRQIRELFEEFGRLTTGELMAAFELSRPTIVADINVLISQQVVRKIDGSHYYESLSGANP